MKLYDPLYSGKASGRHAGGVFSFNRGLSTFKKYTIPHQPNSPEQQAIKNRFSYLTKYWKTSLTYEQITLWNEWNLPWTDIYGNAVLLTGINKFCICNDTLLIADYALRLTPPTLTPSELVITDLSSPGEVYKDITPILDAEVDAQHPFLFIECQDVTSWTDVEGYATYIETNGIPISRKPLTKNYKFVRANIELKEAERADHHVIISNSGIEGTRLICLKVTRINNQGFWSNTVITTTQLTL